MFKWNPKNYRRDTLVGMLKSQAKVGDDIRLRNIRGTKHGISLEYKFKEKWEKCKISSETVDRIIMELYG